MPAQVRYEHFTEAAEAALAARRGTIRKTALRGKPREMYEHLTVAELEEMALIPAARH
ncbi:DUF3008 family protein [Falsirhodobacter algicola]|uniref:DUF3008 family protein n=1 Tax=Falsirhodobacter algicola TaxID=2692330 RepID=A0A8J8MR48_9RHOB|nr:DUF3008 family protein [Falsirhodobacter algicola]QUS34927.1 DUF3008 family protein [Falsirhodobacter algicola]